ncbi:MAG: TIGR01841 family phasin [Rhodospirillales bacterium]|nr:TIGR01841 family phasin [Rhodospirillales bacterium]MDE2319634.1 TIGR01841 family phasin [Rhodospirillales bacterium]
MVDKTGKTTGAKPSMPEFGMEKMMADMKFPAMPDMELVLATHRRNLEAFTAANRAAMEGAQLLARRHMEIMQETMAGLSETMKEFSAGHTPAGHAARQAELLKKAYESAVANSKELGDLIQKSNAEAMSKLNTRFSEAMSEMKTMLEGK